MEDEDAAGLARMADMDLQTEENVIACCEQKLIKLEQIFAKEMFHLREERQRLVAVNKDVDQFLSDMDSFLKSIEEQAL